MNRIVLYVAPDGNDSADGLAPEVCGVSAPFATVTRARDAIREARLKRPDDAYKVILRGGVYRLSETFELTPEDSGTAENPIIYVAAPGEKPVLSGGCLISGWREESLNGRRCWIAELPDAVGAGRRFSQLFVNGQRRYRAALPKNGFFHFASRPSKEGDSPDRAGFKPGDLSADWRNPRDVELRIFTWWWSIHHRIKKIDAVAHEVCFAVPGLGRAATLRDETGGFARYRVENVFEALTEPGEWYCDRVTGKIYYLPMAHEAPDTVECVVPCLETILRLAGKEDRQVSHVRFENVGFEHAEWRPPEWFHFSVQAAFDVPGALGFHMAEQCVLYGCRVAHVSQYGVQIGWGSTGNFLDDCEMTDLGAGGVRVDHEWYHTPTAGGNGICRRPINRAAHGKPSATTIRRCSIHAGGLIYSGAIGVWIGNAGGNRVLDNHIYDLRYTGISCGWTWSFATTATVDNRIEGNHVHHINWEGLLSDNGGIYMLGRQPGGRVCRNHVHHVGCRHYGGRGLYLDDGSSNICVEDNIVHHVYGGLSIKGRNNLVRNNIFALFKDCLISLQTIAVNRVCRFERNLCYTAAPGRLGGRAARWQTRHLLVRDCLFWQEGAAVDFADGVTLDEGRGRGQFIGSRIADPLFADPEGGDFTLRADSPALALGFRPIAAIPAPSGKRPAEWPGPGQVLPPPAELLESGLDWVRDDQVRLWLRNCGAAAVSGRIRVVARPESMVALRNEGAVVFSDLQPGDETEWMLSVEVSGEPDNYTVETIPDRENLPSTSLFVRLKRPLIWIGRASGSPEAALPPILEKAEWSTAQLPAQVDSGNIAAEWRMAVAGPTLFFQARVLDLAVNPDKIAGAWSWDDSMIELFFAPEPLRDRTKGLSQLFIVPAGDCRSVEIWRYGTNKVPVIDHGVTGVCSPLRNGLGYDVLVRLPLGSLHLCPAMKDFLFEVGFNGTFAACTGRSLCRVFKADKAAVNTDGYARVVLQQT